MDYSELLRKLHEADSLHSANIITKAQADAWKARYVKAYESENVPEKQMPNDISHLPGRMIAGLVDVGKAIARGSGATYEHLERQETERNARNRGKSVVDLYNDIQ